MMKTVGRPTLELYTRMIMPGQYEPRADAFDIILTDLAVHAQQPTHPSSLLRNISRAVRSGKLKRTHTSIQLAGKNQFFVSYDFDEQEILKLLAKVGKRILRIYVPAKGLSVHMAQDALERLRSLEKQHLLTR